MTVELNKIGAFISRLRKDKDWTQAELAEQLHVSHQAVSKWERGESVPDIGTLPAIASFFEITVDELLRGERKMSDQEAGQAGKIVEELARDNTGLVADMLNRGEVEECDLLDLAPIVKASAFDRILEQIDGTKRSAAFLAGMAPFVGEAALDRLVRKSVAGQMELQAIIPIAPFLGPESLDYIVDQVLEGEIEVKSVIGLAPFLGSQRLGRLLELAAAGRMDPEDLVPFASFLMKKASPKQ